ncbi:hypothetical protein ABZY31_22325 [Streptomyces sp. NPDC006529]|uniref:hypothetical protein n=1 Tax=Streptomyces sp. NPDC006529 TaxID=3157177 RepID=UPI0033B1E360
MNKAVWTRTGAALAGAALLVGGLTACGGDEADAGKGGTTGSKGGEAKARTPAEAVKAAYLKTVAAKFAKAELSTVEADGKTSTQSGSKGWYPSSHDVMIKGERPAARSIMIGDLVYTKSDKPVQGKSWMKMNLSKDGKPGVRLNEDPAEYLAMTLGQQGLKHVASERLDGVDTEHYKAVLTHADLVKADDSSKVMEEKNRQYLHESVQEVKSLEIDLWISKDGYPVRVDTVTASGDAGPSKTTAKFSGFGTTPAVQAPPAEDTVAFDDVMKGVDDTLKDVDKSLKETDDKLKGLGY